MQFAAWLPVDFVSLLFVICVYVRVYVFVCVLTVFIFLCFSLNVWVCYHLMVK